MTTRRFFALLTALLLLGCAAPRALGAEVPPGPAAPYDPLAQLPADRQPQAPVELRLAQDWHITGSLALIALDPELAGEFGSLSPASLGETFFGQGALAVTQPVTILAGQYQIVVEEGASLILEELAPGSSLTVQGENPDGVFFVEAGGSLTLNQVKVEAAAPAVSLEAGALYEWGDANGKYPKPSAASEGDGLRALALSPGFAGIGELRVYGDDPWLDSLPAEHLPTLPVICAVGGVQEAAPRQLAVAWDTAAAAEALAARQDCTLTGTLLDEAGRPVEADFAVQLPVRFLPREPVDITDALWEELSPGNYWAELRFEAPFEARSVRLEASRDEGASWQALADSPDKLNEYWSLGLALQNAAPALYRVAVEGGPNAGFSQAVLLPPAGSLTSPSQDQSAVPGGQTEGTGSDIGGNRGGGSALDTPDRPLAESPAAGPTPQPAAAGPESQPEPEPEPEPEPDLESEPEPEPETSAPAAPEPASAAPAQAAADAAGQQPPAQTESFSPGAAAAAVAGVAVCAVAALAAAKPGFAARLAKKFKR